MQIALHVGAAATGLSGSRLTARTAASLLQFLRKKGLASADKKAGRIAAEGAVWSYIHAGSR